GPQLGLPDAARFPDRPIVQCVAAPRCCRPPALPTAQEETYHPNESRVSATDRSGCGVRWQESNPQCVAVRQMPVHVTPAPPETPQVPPLAPQFAPQQALFVTDPALADGQIQLTQIQWIESERRPWFAQAPFVAFQREPSPRPEANGQIDRPPENESR